MMVVSGIRCVSLLLSMCNDSLLWRMSLNNGLEICEMICVLS